MEFNDYSSQGIMHTVLKQYTILISGGDPYMRQYFLLRSIKPMVSLISIYLVFVKCIGPLIMKNRRPIELRRVIILYNLCLIIYFVYFLLRGIYFLYQLGLYQLFCSSFDSRNNPVIAELYFHGYIYYVSKFVELIDTVFLVLSKKFKMITPLHVFHHAVVPVVGWFAMRSERNAYLSLFMALNSFIHMIMYIYYSVAALGPAYQKYLWWKKYLTTLQIAQFLVMFVYLKLMYVIGCATSQFTIAVFIAGSVLFFVWFIVYYKNTYTKRKEKLQKVVHTQEETPLDKTK